MHRLLATTTVLLVSLAAPSAGAENRFQLVNSSGQVVQEAYVSPSRVEGWGPDMLAGGMLPAGNETWVTSNFSACVVDVRVRFASGIERTRARANVCINMRVFIGRDSITLTPDADVGGVAGALIGAAVGGTRGIRIPSGVIGANPDGLPAPIIESPNPFNVRRPRP